jgi:hypothetical protein
MLNPFFLTFFQVKAMQNKRFQKDFKSLFEILFSIDARFLCLKSCFYA